MYSITDLIRAYQEPHRKYHNLNHIVYMLNTAEKNKQHLSDQQILAIWYHDFVYNPISSLNEEDSSFKACKQLMAEGYHTEFIFIVSKIIMDTKEHLPTHEQSKLVIDLDLASLAEPEDVYIETGHKIRTEFSHLNDEQWELGRSKFISKFLGRPTIFHSAWGLEKLEYKARENLNNERIRLGF